jgi:hypothetical protein
MPKIQGSGFSFLKEKAYAGSWTTDFQEATKRAAAQRAPGRKNGEAASAEK